MYLITSHHDGEYIPESITYVKNVDDKKRLFDDFDNYPVINPLSQ